MKVPIQVSAVVRNAVFWPARKNGLFGGAPCKTGRSGMRIWTKRLRLCAVITLSRRRSNAPAFTAKRHAKRCISSRRARRARHCWTPSTSASAACISRRKTPAQDEALARRLRLKSGKNWVRFVERAQSKHVGISLKRLDLRLRYFVSSAKIASSSYILK